MVSNERSLEAPRALWASRISDQLGRRVAARGSRSTPQAQVQAQAQPNIRARRRGLRIKEVRRLYHLRGAPQRDADAIIATPDFPIFSAIELGWRVALRFSEFKQMRSAPKTMRPYDATDADVTAFLKERKRKRQKRAAQEKRDQWRREQAQRAATLARNQDLDVRGEAVFAALDDDWRTIAQLAADLAGHRAFKRPDGRAMQPDSFRRVLRRELEHLKLIDSLGLAITEGVEDGLSVHEATGLGAWAAGSASRLPALADAVPDYVEYVTIMRDSDPAGRAGATELAQRLTARRVGLTVVSL